METHWQSSENIFYFLKTDALWKQDWKNLPDNFIQKFFLSHFCYINLFFSKPALHKSKTECSFQTDTFFCFVFALFIRGKILFVSFYILSSKIRVFSVSFLLTHSMQVATSEQCCLMSISCAQVSEGLFRAAGDLTASVVMWGLEGES